MKVLRFVTVIALALVALVSIARATYADGPTPVPDTAIEALSEQMANAPRGAALDGVSPEVAVPTNALVGAWHNANAGTRSITRILIGRVGNNLAVHTYGKCSPTDCDWGTVTGYTYATSVGSSAGIGFSAVYNFSFAQVINVGYLSGNSLYVFHFTRFTDNSGRSNYFGIERFVK